MTSFEISYEDGYRYVHPKYPFKLVEGFKITSTKEPNILEIQFYDQHFDITVDALGGSWAGWSILFRHGYWIRLPQTWFRQNDRAFRLRNTPAGYVIGGSCCGHGTRVSDQQLGECWNGGILLAENHGGWRRFIEHMWSQFTRFLWMVVGRHVSKLAWRPLNASKRRGIMHEPQDAVW